ncbi:ABC transporter substrate-binding protein [Pseudolabrys sp. FHR47]|uniref:ABC transporter substrate-binding protein n=1 Tax=Pseudolabrys sp. FHR47 TaxID=2562284 RepID=UPI0010BE5E81|nr:ABC transporter substrate-binding protein [Pseudolabrys sp. FHR47]
MTFSPRSFLVAAAAVIGLTAPLLTPAPAAAQTKLKMVLNWKYQGPQGWFFLAEDRGYFKKAGIDIQMDQGNGSGAPIPLVANGTYDVGFGDINALIQFAATKPAEAPIAVYVMYNQPPFTVAVRADSPIKTPKDFEGKKLGGAAGDGALKLFPALCKIAKIDCTKVEITNMQPNLREQMLMNKQVDGVFGYVNTIRFSAKLMGVADNDIRYVNYGDYGMNLYSNAIIVSKKLVAEKPEVVKGLVAAINQGLQDALKDPDAAIAAVAKREPLIKPAVEKERFMATLHDEMNSPEIAKIGLGNVDKDRLKKSIDILVEANGLTRTPTVDEVFTDKFIPPVAELPKKLF